MPNCRSNVLYKGALQGDKASKLPEARTCWVGDVLIRAEAKGTDTYETNRNLVLTDGARADAIPNLEIETGEIAGAGHAATVGRFDDDQLFYLRSRGIREEDATRLIIRGFFNEVLNQIPVESVREELIARVAGELERNENKKEQYMSTLEIKNLHANVLPTEEGQEPKPILKGVNLTIKGGETHAIMGPNGSGKSTLAYTLAGHPKYEVTEGEVLLDGENVQDMEIDERARAGLFLAMQYPVEVPGVSSSNFMRSAVTAVRGEAPKLREWVGELNAAREALQMDASFSERSVNEGFSGGEKKRHEVMQLDILKPKFAVMDETDSGLDVDALRIVSEGINSYQKAVSYTHLRAHETLQAISYAVM